MTAATIKITETEPVTLVKDFDTFTNYLREYNPSLVRKDHLLTRKTLYEIEQLMSHPDPESTPKTPIIFYPHLILFYYAILRGNLFVKTRELKLQETERLSEYQRLTPTEKYFFLLETFWVDSFWDKLLGEKTSLLLIPDAQSIVDHLATVPPGKAVSVKESGSTLELWSIHPFLYGYLSCFGLVQITYDIQGPKTKERRLYPVDSVTVTDLGRVLFPILAGKRNLEQWNIPYIREKTGEFIIFPGKSENQEYEPFFKSFQGLFKEELQKTLPRDREYTGTFVFKVFAKRSVWRTIKTSSEHTLEDLHNAIQDAFGFDKDHLYAFFMDGIPWSRDAIYAPGTDEGPFSDQVFIGKSGLQPMQRIVYLFDFGDEWVFNAEVLEVSSKPGPASPEIIEKKGTAPNQYSW